MSSPHFLVLLLLLGAVVTLAELGLVAMAFEQLGLSAHSAYLLLITTLAGSFLNLPLFRLNAERTAASEILAQWRRSFGLAGRGEPGKVIIAVNVGGCVVPVAFCVYLLSHHDLSPLHLLAAIAVVSAVAWLFSRPVRGVGIGIPVLIAPLTAAVIARLLDPQLAAPTAYIAGTLGVLIGADLLRLPDIRRMGAPLASIGGAGSFDGIFVTGLLAVLLLAL